MSSVNVRNRNTETTHEGAPAQRINAEQQLRRSVMACLLWEDSFYESGEDIAQRIIDCVAKVKPETVAAIAIEARKKLRHVPLLLVRAMAALPTHRHLVAETLYRVIQRPDEITEFMAIYWKNGKCPISAQVKRGLARAFGKFNEYSLAKYNRDGAIKLRDVLFLCHADPRETLSYIGATGQVDRKYVDKKTGKITTKTLERNNHSLFAKLINNQLATPDTWEVALSAGANKKESFTRLLNEEKLGALAFIRNLRNMRDAGVDERLVMQCSQSVKLERVLPFRFISAARAVPAWEPMIESMMLRCLADVPKLLGKTMIVVDNSGSMYQANVSKKSDITRADAAAALAILIREICDNVCILAFSNKTNLVPARRGFALRDAIQAATPHGATNTQLAIHMAAREKYNRIIVITDEQSHTQVNSPLTKQAYFINVSVEKNGIGYGPWTHIDGWSESIVDYIQSIERVDNVDHNSGEVAGNL